MANVIICDRCSALSIGKLVGHVDLRYPLFGDQYQDGAQHTETHDLCPDCCNDFVQWLTHGPNRSHDVIRRPFERPEPTNRELAMLNPEPTNDQFANEEW